MRNWGDQPDSDVLYRRDRVETERRRIQQDSAEYRSAGSSYNRVISPSQRPFGSFESLPPVTDSPRHYVTATPPEGPPPATTGRLMGSPHAPSPRQGIVDRVTSSPSKSSPKRKAPASKKRLSPQAEYQFEGIRRELKTLYDVPVAPDKAREFETFVDTVMDFDTPKGRRSDEESEDPDLQEIIEHLQKEIDARQDEKGADDEIFQATKQKVKNIQLLVAVNDNEEGVRNEHGKLMEQCENARMDLAVRFQKGDELISKFDRETKCTLLSQYSKGSLCAETGLGMGVKEVQELKAEPLTDTETFKRVLSELLATKAAKRRREFLEQSMKKAINRSEDNNVLDLIFPMYDMLHSDLLSTHHITEVLRSYNEKVMMLEKQIAEVERLRQTALTDEDMPRAEQHHNESIALQEELLRLGYERLATLTRRGGQDKLLQDLQAHTEKGMRSLDNARSVQVDLIGRVDADLTKLDDRIAREAEEDKATRAAFQKFREGNTAFLAENTNRQDDTMAQIIALFKDIDQLGRERLEAVKNRIETTQREEKRSTEYGQFRDVALDHRGILDTSIQKAKKCIEAIDSSEDFMKDAGEQIHKKVAMCDQELKELRLKEHQNNLTVFRRYYLTVGELLYRKEKRMQEFQRATRSTDLRLDMVKETLDENQQRYRMEQREARAGMEMTQNKIEVLKDKLEDSAEDFKFTEDALEDAGITFIHPAVELQELNVTRRAKVLGVRKQYQERDEEEVMGEDTTIQKISQLTETARKSPSKAGHHRDMTPRRLDKSGMM